MSLSLSERHRRRSEVRSLAVRCSVYVGEYEPFVRRSRIPINGLPGRCTLKRSAKRWRSPRNAASIRETFERVAGNDGPALYRMLWGYSSSDLERPAPTSSSSSI